MITLKNITKKYDEKLVLDDLNIELPSEQIVAFIGSNGAGKSTVLNIVSRLIPANSGTVTIDDKSLKQWDNKELAKELTILGQSIHTPARLTVGELVNFGRFPHCGGKLGQEDIKIVKEALEYTGISDLENRYIDELSGGQRQIAYIAMALAQDTKYILLDEPLNNLDMGRSKKLMQLLQMLVKEKNKTIFIVIHDINFVSFYADYVVGFKNGKLSHHGKVESIIEESVLKELYGIDIRIEDFEGKRLCVYY